MADGRPYDDLAALSRDPGAIVAELDDAELAAALGRPPAHRRAGGPGTTPSSRRKEQSAVDQTDAATTPRCRRQPEYEERFGRIYLVGGRPQRGELLAELRRRLGDDQAERAERGALRELALHRLRDVLELRARAELGTSEFDHAGTHRPHLAPHHQGRNRT